jgi:hypothetical protein
MKRLLLAGFTVAGLSCLSFGPAHAVIIYDFSGTCTSGCTGTATGVLTLAETYIPGTTVAVSDFLSWTYMSSNGSVSINDVQGSNLTLPVTSGIGTGGLTFGAASGVLMGDSFGGSSGPSDWTVFFQTPSLPDPNVGTSHNWAMVPEPSTLGILAVGLAAMAVRRERTA